MSAGVAALRVLVILVPGYAAAWLNRGAMAWVMPTVVPAATAAVGICGPAKPRRLADEEGVSVNNEGLSTEDGELAGKDDGFG